jgi:hypothetical protein
MNMGMVRDVMEILQQGYGDNTSTPLDRVVATKVIGYFYDKGWMSSEEIAFLVESAGGEIRVTEKTLAGEAPLLYRQEDPMNGDFIFRTRSKEDLVANAKVNPQAEARVVDPGKIEIKLVEKRNDSPNPDS